MYFHGGLRINGNDVMGMNDLWEIDLNTYVEKKFKDGPGRGSRMLGLFVRRGFV